MVPNICLPNGKNSTCQCRNARDTALIPGSGISLEVENGNPLQYSCLENPRDGGAWWAVVYGVAQSRTRLKRLSSSSSKSFIVFGLIFRSLIHFEFIFVFGIRKCSNFILLHVTVQFSQHHLLKRLSALLYTLSSLSKISYP